MILSTNSNMVMMYSSPQAQSFIPPMKVCWSQPMWQMYAQARACFSLIAELRHASPLMFHGPGDLHPTRN
jgi:hypothetical protein